MWAVEKAVVMTKCFACRVYKERTRTQQPLTPTSITTEKHHLQSPYLGLSISSPTSDELGFPQNLKREKLGDVDSLAQTDGRPQTTSVCSPTRNVQKRSPTIERGLKFLIQQRHHSITKPSATLSINKKKKRRKFPCRPDAGRCTPRPLISQEKEMKNRYAVPTG